MKTSKPAFAPFNANTRKKIHAVMADMGLTLISTRRQIANGTLMYRDPETNCLYSFHESGYCRRYIPQRLHWGTAFESNDTRYAMYQLNRTQYGTKTTTYNGREYTSYQKIRILANPVEQLGIVSAAIALYRQNC